MTTAVSGTCTEGFVDAADLRVQLRRGGKGEPLLVLHSELGVPGWLQAYEALAEHFTVYVPSLPGFGQSARPDWIVSVRDLAAWVTWFARDLRLPQPMYVLGFSMGGWVAAEIATINTSIFKKMVLVAPAGLKPEEGEIWDYFANSAQGACARAFYNPAQAPEYMRNTTAKPGRQRKKSRPNAIGRWPPVCCGNLTCAATPCGPCYVV